MSQASNAAYSSAGSDATAMQLPGASMGALSVNLWFDAFESKAARQRARLRPTLMYGFILYLSYFYSSLVVLFRFVSFPPPSACVHAHVVVVVCVCARVCVRVCVCGTELN